MADDEEFELLKEKNAKLGSVVGILRGGIGVLCAAGRMIDEDDDVLADDSNNFFWISDSVFGCMSGDVNNGRSIIRNVMEQVKIVPCISIEEIAGVFIRCANINFIHDPDKRKVEFVLVGRMRDDDSIYMYKIFNNRNDEPAMRRANASNPISVKVCSGPILGPFVAFRQVACAIGAGCNDALNSLRTDVDGSIKTERKMRKAARKAVIKSTKADCLTGTGGNINILTLSKEYDGPRFHSSFPVVNNEEDSRRIKYGDIVEGGFMPQGYVRLRVGVRDPLTDSSSKLKMLRECSKRINFREIDAGHCPHDEVPFEINSIIQDWIVSVECEEGTIINQCIA